MERIATGWKALGVGGAAMTVLAQTKPEEAISNIAAWAKLVGLEHMPSFLMTPRIDQAATVLGLCVLVLALIMWRRQVVHVHHMELAAQSRATPSLEMVVTRAPKTDEWMPLCQALRYLVYESQWAETQPAPTDRNDFDKRVSVEIIERLARGDITARGKLGWTEESLSRPTEPIDSGYWVSAFMQPHGEIVLASPDTQGTVGSKASDKSYRSVIVQKEQVDLAWPQRTDADGLTALAQFVEPMRAKIAEEKGGA
jgi:hypothetical protein